MKIPLPASRFTFHVSRFTFHASPVTRHLSPATCHLSPVTGRPSRPLPAPRGQQASAVLVVLALVAIVLVYIAANSRTLYLLGREVKLVERQQIRRLELTSPTTNSVHKVQRPIAGTNQPLPRAIQP